MTAVGPGGLRPPAAGGPDDTGELLGITDLSVSFGGLTVLDAVSLSVGRGSIAALVGESGSGKSVLARSVIGLAGRGARVEGSIRLEGRELTSLSESELVRLRGAEVSLMVQDAQSALNPVYRIGTQMIEALSLKSPEFASRGRRDKVLMRRRAAELLAEAGIDHPEERLDRFPHQLSGGMCQRVMLAMALLASPKLLIADEPTTALDVSVQRRILGQLTDLARRRGSSVVLISHDLHLVGELADHLIVLYAGRVMESGPAAEVLARPANPYTRGLMAATLRLDTPKGSLKPIPGEAPAPDGRDRGCLFRERCPEADQVCSQRPPMALVGAGRLSSCHHAKTPSRPVSPADLAA